MQLAYLAGLSTDLLHCPLQYNLHVFLHNTHESDVTASSESNYLYKCIYAYMLHICKPCMIVAFEVTDHARLLADVQPAAGHARLLADVQTAVHDL